MSKTILWIVLAVVVVGGGIWWWSMSHTATQSPATATTAQTQTQAGNSNGTQASSAPAGNSDQAINQTMANVNAQMNGFSSDSASINQGLNDQPVQQSQF